MSKLKIYIVEDEDLYANQLEMIVDQLDYELIGISDNSDHAQKAIEDTKPDLILMDVKINGSMNGIDLATSLNYNPIIIFITSFDDNATFSRAKQAKPHAFITKPFDAQNLERTIELALTQSTNDSDWKNDIVFEHSIFIKNRNRLEKVDISDILYLEVEDRYSTIFTRHGLKLVLRMSMGDVMQKLPEKEFLRIHRKYTINLNEISSIDTQDNLIKIGEVVLPISRSHKEELLEKLDWLQ